jgi:hypothetical protein
VKRFLARNTHHILIEEFHPSAAIAKWFEQNVVFRVRRAIFQNDDTVMIDVSVEEIIVTCRYTSLPTRVAHIDMCHGPRH